MVTQFASRALKLAVQRIAGRPRRATIGTTEVCFGFDSLDAPIDQLLVHQLAGDFVTNLGRQFFQFDKRPGGFQTLFFSRCQLKNHVRNLCC
jgi:hypothetical protein